MTIISWNSWELQRVTRSSSGAEVQAASEAREEAEYTRLVFAELIYGKLAAIKDWADLVKEVRSCLVMDCRGVFNALSKSESSGLGMRDKRAGLEALALRQAVYGNNYDDFEVVPQPGAARGHDDQYNASTVETWRFFHERQSWKLVYDPDFVNAKKRAQKGLTILDDQDVVSGSGEKKRLAIKTANGDDFEFDVADDNDAWLCIGSELAQWSTTLEESDPKIDTYYNGDIVAAIRRAGS